MALTPGHLLTVMINVYFHRCGCEVSMEKYNVFTELPDVLYLHVFDLNAMYYMNNY